MKVQVQVQGDLHGMCWSRYTELHTSFQVITAVVIRMMIVLCFIPCRSVVTSDVSEEPTAFIFKINKLVQANGEHVAK